MLNLSQRDIINAADTNKRLVQDEEYYRYIFKKTEKIVSVVFYILYNLPEDKRTAVHIEDLQHVARQVHDAILQSLETRIYASEDSVRAAALALIALESKLRISQTAGVVSSELVQVLVAEIDSVLRGMNRYIKSPNADSTGGEDTFAPLGMSDEPRRRRAPERKREPEASADATSAEGRRDRIKTVLQAKGRASIKDISEIVADVSEKTIQRELNAMIEDNVVQRQGERRWSVYSLK